MDSCVETVWSVRNYVDRNIITNREREEGTEEERERERREWRKKEKRLTDFDVYLSALCVVCLCISINTGI